MQMYAIRLREGEDLRQSIIKFVTDNKLSSATIVTVVGSLSRAVIRMAGAQPDRQDIRTYQGSYEIVSLVGTVTKHGAAHLHISISDTDGKVIGGHLKDGSIVHTTAELVIASDPSLEFDREVDDVTGFDELVVKRNK